MMDDNLLENLCPICQRPNEPGAERCWYCQAVLSEKKEGNSDWLNDLREDSEPQAGSQPLTTSEPQEESETPEEIPDWLARIRTRELMERENLSANQEDSSSSEPERNDLPDWLKEIKAGNSGITPPEDAETNHDETIEKQASEAISLPMEPKTDDVDATEEEDTQEWLEKLAAWQPDIVEQKEDIAQEAFSLEPKIQKSDQYRGFEEPAEQPAAAKPNEDESKETPQLDPSEGWHRIFLEETQAASPEIDQIGQSLEAEFGALAPDDGNSVSDLLEEPENDFKESDAQQLGPFVDQTEEQPASFQSHESAAAEQPGETIAPESFDRPPFVEDDLPDWLSQAKIDESQNETSTSTDLPGSDEEEFAAAESEKSEPFTETQENITQLSSETGLLAGISGVLNPMQSEQDFRRPVGYGSALKVTENQKKNAALFASIVEDTFIEETDEVDVKKGKSLRVLFQLILGGLLVAIMILGKTSYSVFAIQPVLFPPEVVAVFDQVNALPAEKPVLVIADFEAAVYGELSWSSHTLLEHLLRKNLPLVLASTTPSGTTMLTKHITEIGQKIPAYNLDSHLVNLGYLAGGSTGLQFLSGDIRSALPFTHDFEAAWRSPVLESVRTLNDMGAVLILSDNAEHARFWVEQIEPGLEAVPLMFVSSAQSAPLLQPYYQSGQVSGYIAGFTGSLAYENIFMQPSIASENLTSFQASLLFVAAIILIGGLVSLLRPDNTNRKVD